MTIIYINYYKNNNNNNNNNNINYSRVGGSGFIIYNNISIVAAINYR